MSNITTAQLRAMGIKVPPRDEPPRSVFTITEGTRAVAFDVPVRTKTETNNNDHWRARKRRADQQAAAVTRAMTGLSVPPLPVVVTFTRRSPSVMDCDNLPSASKHIRDQIAKLYGVKDSPTDPIAWRYEQVKCKPGNFGVKVQIVRQS